MTESSTPGADRNQLARAIGSLVWSNPERILDTVSALRGTGAVIECRLRGGSMEPAIPRGATLRIHLGRTAPYRIGEVVAFVQDAGICVHRVARLGRGRRTRDLVITQGDACFYPDPPVSTRQILGPVIEFRLGEHWTPAGDRPTAGRARSLLGRILLGLVSGLMELDSRLARCAARVLRIRKESPAVAEA